MQGYVDAGGKILRYPERLAQWKQGRDLYPGNVELDLSDRCNRKCRGCHFAYHHGERDLSPELALSAWHQMMGLGVCAVVITGGGEPTMNPDFEGIVRAFAAQRVGRLPRLGLYTNATRFSEFSSTLWNCFDWVYCSLEDPPREIVEANPETVFGRGRLLDATNCGPKQLAQYVAEWEVSPAHYLQFRPLIEPGTSTVWIHNLLNDLCVWHEYKFPDGRYLDTSRQKFLDYLDSAQGNRGYSTCRACRFIGVIGADGEVWQCVNRRGITSLGNLNSESLHTIWRNAPYSFPVDDDCRIMCRGHALNVTLEQRVFGSVRHGEFF